MEKQETRKNFWKILHVLAWNNNLLLDKGYYEYSTAHF